MRFETVQNLTVFNLWCPNYKLYNWHYFDIPKHPANTDIDTLSNNISLLSCGLGKYILWRLHLSFH